jgi:hypothetical protein
MVYRNVLRKRKSDENSDNAVDKTAANVDVRLFCGFYLMVTTYHSECVADCVP